MLVSYDHDSACFILSPFMRLSESATMHAYDNALYDIIEHSHCYALQILDFFFLAKKCRPAWKVYFYLLEHTDFRVLDGKLGISCAAAFPFTLAVLLAKAFTPCISLEIYKTVPILHMVERRNHKQFASFVHRVVVLCILLVKILPSV